MNSGFLITNAGLAAASIATPTGPYVHITQFRVGSGVNYTPTTSATGLAGTTLYIGTPTSYTIVDSDSVEVMLIMAADVGTFQFGEIGLYLATGELFAISVFDTLQEKIRAVGNQAGTVWRIRARIKLAQAPAIVQFTLINSQSILEVPNWQSLAKPADQIMNANIAIVHANNSSDDPVLVIKDSDNEWGLIDYHRSFLGNTSDSGASLSTSTFTHPDISSLYFEGTPRSDSKYLIKFPDGSIRKITNSLAPGQVSFSPVVSGSQTGPVSIWEEGGSGGRISWADTYEYNDFVSDFNPYWANPVGPYRIAPDNAAYPTGNKGIGETALTTLTRRTNSTDWATLLTAVRANCQIHNIDITDLANIYDFVYRPVAPNFFGMESLRQQWQALSGKIALLEANRNVFNTTLQDQVLLGSNAYSLFWSGVKNFTHTFDYGTTAHRQGMLNAGHEIRISGGVTSIVHGDWHEANSLLSAVGLMTVKHDTVTASAGTASGVGLHELLLNTYTLMFSHTAFNWTLSLYGRRASSDQIQLELRLDNTASSPTGYGYGSNPGTITWSTFSRRPSSALISTPVLAHPALTFATS